MNNDISDVIVVGGIDSFMPIEEAGKNVVLSIRERIEEAIAAGDLLQVGKIGKSLLSVAQVSGVAFAEMLYTVEACWSSFDQNQDFWEWAEDTFGRKEITLRRQYRVWEMFVSGDIPKEYVEKFKTMPIRTLIPVGAMWDKGYDVEPAQWRKLSNAPDPSTVSKIIKEITGAPERKNSLNIEWISDQKVLVGWKNGKPHHIKLQFDEDDEVCQQVLARLFGDGRVLEK